MAAIRDQALLLARGIDCLFFFTDLRLQRGDLHLALGDVIGGLFGEMLDICRQCRQFARSIGDDLSPGWRRWICRRR